MLMLHYAVLFDAPGICAMQNVTGKRTPSDYVLVPNPEANAGEFEAVWMQLHLTMVGLIPEAETGIRFDVIKAVLREWCKVTPEERAIWEKDKTPNAPIFNSKAWSARKNASLDAEVRIYDNAVDLILAIVGHIRSRQVLKYERLIAVEVLKSPEVREHVLNVCKVIVGVIDSRGLGDAADGFVRGEYESLHGFTSFKAWSGSFLQCDTAKNIMILHDIARKYDTDSKWSDSWSGPSDPETVAKRGFESKSTMRHNVGTVNEDTAWAMRARFANLPVWAGPSGTTKMLCHTLTKIGNVSVDELLACVYSLFALWASDLYPKTATPIHHLFGVMSGAEEFLPSDKKYVCEPLHVLPCLERFLYARQLRAKL